MHVHDLQPFAHDHAFIDAGAAGRSRALWAVTLLTLVTMAVELAVGWWSASMALWADGWHMGTHAAALGGAALAGVLARRARKDSAYAFGGWKIEMLAAYTSGLMLLGASLWLLVEAVGVLRQPRPVAYDEAMAVAVLGLVVNLASVWLLERGQSGAVHHAHAACHAHPHVHDHAHEQATAHGHHDLNFRAAYLHVVADAITSVLAIVALAAGKWFGLAWLDPAVALVAAVLIARWAFGVLRQASRALVDATADEALRRDVRALIEADGDATLADLHVWQVGPRSWSVAASLVADRPLEPTAYRDRLAAIDGLHHVTVEVHRCRGGR
jgi:cation diffusion facilitator family transporter